MLQRMIGVATFKVSTYEEIEADKSATSQAIIVVILVAIATGIGGAGAAGWLGMVVGVIGAIIGWVLWAWITFFIGTTLFRTAETKADWGELARAIGFAQTPGLLRILGIVGVISGFVFLIASVWQLATMVVGVRQALDYKSTWRAVGVVVVGFIPLAVLMVVITTLLPGAGE
ncbi:MAG: YIP1 family protein [Chloroflexi bacterium]|nr:YIP1 family protein [Chloroflexota bacterium]